MNQEFEIGDLIIFKYCCMLIVGKHCIGNSIHTFRFDIVDMTNGRSRFLANQCFDFKLPDGAYILKADK